MHIVKGTVQMTAQFIQSGYDRDPEVANLQFLKKYECQCGAKWEDVSSCLCDDRCPTCNNSCGVKEYEDA